MIITLMNGGGTVCKGCFIEKMTETNTYAKKSLISRFYPTNTVENMIKYRYMMGERKVMPIDRKAGIYER